MRTYNAHRVHQCVHHMLISLQVETLCGIMPLDSPLACPLACPKMMERKQMQPKAVAQHSDKNPGLGLGLGEILKILEI